MGGGVAMAASADSAPPNILLIVADDLGYSDLGSYGGAISVHPPWINWPKEGLQFTHMYAAPTCSITRSMLMSGTDNHLAGLGTVAEALQPFQRGKPGYEGYLNQRSYSIAELLKQGGYSTLMVGKWHLGLEADQGPDQRGFQQSSRCWRVVRRTSNPPVSTRRRSSRCTTAKTARPWSCRRIALLGLLHRQADQLPAKQQKGRQAVFCLRGVHFAALAAASAQGVSGQIQGTLRSGIRQRTSGADRAE